MLGVWIGLVVCARWFAGCLIYLGLVLDMSCLLLFFVCFCDVFGVFGIVFFG